jgi:hypothetical protein
MNEASASLPRASAAPQVPSGCPTAGGRTVKINPDKLRIFNALGLYLIQFQSLSQKHCSIINNPLLQNGQLLAADSQMGIA